MSHRHCSCHHHTLPGHTMMWPEQTPHSHIQLQRIHKCHRGSRTGTGTQPRMLRCTHHRHLDCHHHIARALQQHHPHMMKTWRALMVRVPHHKATEHTIERNEHGPGTGSKEENHQETALQGEQSGHGVESTALVIARVSLPRVLVETRARPHFCGACVQSHRRA